MKLKGVLVVTIILAALQIASATTILYESFSGLVTWPPTGWSIDSTGNCRKWVRRGSGQVFRTDTSAGVVIANYSIWGNLTGTSYLKTPSMNFSSSGIESLSFYFRCPSLAVDSFALGSRLDTLKVEVSTNGTTWTPVLTIDSNYIRSLPRQAAILDTGIKQTVSLAAYNGQTSVYIRWILYDNWPGNVGTNRYFNIDSVYVYDRPAAIEENRLPLSANRISLAINPNPFRNFTSISFNAMPKDVRSIKIYDVTGNIVRVLTEIGSNIVMWDGKNGDGHLITAGVYFIKLETTQQTKIGKLMLLR